MLSLGVRLGLELLILIHRCLPLDAVAVVGRFAGGLAYLIDRRHRAQALRNLLHVFGRPRPALAREHFRRLGETYSCAIKLATMGQEALDSRVERHGFDRLGKLLDRHGKVVVALGHFGNFELFSRVGGDLGNALLVTTYRALGNPAADRVLTRLRSRPGVLFFERRSQFGKLMRTLREDRRMVLGLLSDQHDARGETTRFLGRECRSSRAAAVLAQRLDAPLITAICFRTSRARWRIEVGERVALDGPGGPRGIREIVQEVQDAFSEAVRRDPPNWFWVHRRWRF